jgi:SAM-dependent methyltransferase
MDDTPAEKPPHAILFEMLFGAWTAKVLAEVVRLGVPDVLTRGPATALELTEHGVRADARALHRALRACAALGVVTEDAQGRFGPTRLSSLLTRDAPGSAKRLVEYSGGLLWKVWTGLPEALQTGEPQARARLGLEFFDYLAANPAALEEFGETLRAHSFTVNQAVLEHYDFSGLRDIVDVGAGYGHLIVAVLGRYRDARGVVFDLPEVIAQAPERLPIDDPWVAERLRYVAGNMFESVPPADAYLLKMILHDWDDASCAKVLRHCGAALAPGGRVICIDPVMPPLGDTSDVPSKLLDVNMMLLLPGKERTRVEWDALFAASGLRVASVRRIPDAFGTCIIEGRKIDG